MLIVVEGISASGKTSWCAEKGAGYVIPEHGCLSHVPDHLVDPVGAATFWVERNVERWQAAIEMEKSAPWVLCDSDPLKLHYSWCLWQVGAMREQDWRLALAATRAAIARRQLGFADAYLCNSLAPELARARAQADSSRRRGRFELHVRLQPGLLAWYRALGAVLPGRLSLGFPAVVPQVEPLADRYSLAAFDRLIATLPDLGAYGAIP